MTKSSIDKTVKLIVYRRRFFSLFGAFNWAWTKVLDFSCHQVHPALPMSWGFIASVALWVLLSSSLSCRTGQSVLWFPWTGRPSRIFFWFLHEQPVDCFWVFQKPINWLTSYLSMRSIFYTFVFLLALSFFSSCFWSVWPE